MLCDSDSFCYRRLVGSSLTPLQPDSPLTASTVLRMAIQVRT